MTSQSISLGPTISDLRVLNLDDNEIARYTKSESLRRAGFNVREASTAAEALQILALDEIDVAVLDVDLPDMNGLEVTRRIRADPVNRTIKIVQVSATYVNDGDELSSLERGADIYLRCPFEPAAFSTVVETLGRLRRAEILFASHIRREAVGRGSGVAAAQFDLAGYVTATNQAYCEMLQRTSQDLCLLSLDELVHAKDADRVIEMFREMTRGARQDFRTKLRQRSGDGSLLLLDCSFSSMRSMGGSVRAVLCSVIAVDPANP